MSTNFEFPASGWLNDNGFEGSIARSDVIIRGIVRHIETSSTKDQLDMDLGMVEIDSVDVFKMTSRTLQKPFQLYILATGSAVVDAPQFNIGEEVLLFCSSDAAGHNYPLGGPMGKYLIKDGLIVQEVNKTSVPIEAFLNQLRDILQEHGKKSPEDATRRYEKVMHSIGQHKQKEAIQGIYVLEGLYPDDERIKKAFEQLKTTFKMPRN